MKFKALFAAALVMTAFLVVGCEEDIIWGDWIKSSDFNGVARSDAVSFTIGEKNYVCGGYDGKDRLSDLWEYDVDIDNWTKKAAFPGTPRTGATAFSLNGKGYLGTGYDGDDYLRDFWEYDPDTDTWTQIADLGIEDCERSGAISFSLGNYGYVGTGYNGNYLKDIWKYDPSTNTWTETVSVGGSKRYNATAFVYNGYAYVVCGVNNGSYISDFWKFDPSDQSWTKLRAIDNLTDDDFDDDYDDITRAYGLPLIIGDRIFITCGEDGSLTSTTWEYKPASDLWEERGEFEGTSRTAAVSIHTSDRAFVLLGRSSTYRFEDMWEFLPTVEYDEDTY